jgi:class 3 adenylate cyclase/ligand-binding sensor domain-containing protein
MRKFTFFQLVLFAILSFFSLNQLIAQNYIPLSYSSSYPQNLVEFQSNGSFTQDTNGIMYVGFSHGVFEFDGKRKSFHAIESPVLGLDIHLSTNRVYLATTNSFGYLITKTNGELQYIDISTKKLTLNDQPNEQFAKVFCLKDRIYVYYPSTLYIVNPSDNSFSNISLKNKDGFTSLGAFLLNDQLYISLSDKGLCRFDKDKPVTVLADVTLSTHLIKQQTVFDKNKVLFVTNDNQLFLFDGKAIRPYAPQVIEYCAKTNDQVTGIVVLKDIVIVATSLNGCFILDKSEEKTVSIWNVRYGLRSNEIYAIYADRDERVWMAHADKISWNYVTYPINKYDQGISGNVNDIIQTDNLYVATDNGLYYFTQMRNTDVINEDLFRGILDQFKKIKPMVVEKIPIPEAPKLEVIQQEIAQTSTVEAPKTDPSKAATGIKGWFKSKKSKEEEKKLAEEKLRQEQLAFQQEQERIKREAEARAAQAEAERQEALRKNLEAEAQRQREIAERQRIAQMYEEMKASRQIQSKSIDFDIVPNSPAEKFTCLLNHNGMLLAGSVNNLYMIVNNRAEPIVKQSVKLLCASTKFPDRVYCVSPDNSLGCFFIQNNQWSYQKIEKQQKEFISSIAEDQNGYLWLGSLRGAFQVEIQNFNTTPKINKLAPLNETETSARAVVVRQMEGKVILFQNKKAFTYENKAFREITDLSKLCQNSNGTYQLMKGLQHYWLLTGKNLYKLRVDPSLSRITVADSSRMLALTNRINIFFPDNNDQLWIGDNEKILKFIPAKSSGKEPNKKFRCQIRSVQTVKIEDGKTIKMPVASLFEELSLPYAGHYNIEFEFTAPAYDHAEIVHYEYKLGTDDNWKIINVNNLNLEFEWGKYEMRVRAIDAFGNRSEEAVFRFEINSPFWAKWYFWTIVVGIIGFGVWRFVQYRQQALLKRKKELEDEVARATVQIREQNSQLEQSNLLLQDQNDKLERFNNEISKQKEEIAYQKQLSDSLLLNILPVQIAEELKTKNKADARKYELVSVLFTDFKGFTMAAEKMTPEQLVVELNECFMKFDEIIDRHGLEKIKTLGDGYMCAGGIPTPNVTNPVDIILAGLEIQLYMNQFALERQKQNKLAWQVRLGIHSGELIAGVVGKKKFAYDIWGDTVNTASRMESSGEPAKVNISGTTYELVKEFFDCTYRGKIPAKNKGEISMYFVNSIKKELSVNGQGLVPNEKFKQLLAKYNDEMSKKYRVQPVKEVVS